MIWVVTYETGICSCREKSRRVRFYSKPFSRFWGGFWESRFYYTLTGKKLHLSADSNPLLIKLRWFRVSPFEHLYSLRHGGTALGESQSDLKYLLLFHVPLSFIRKKKKQFHFSDSYDCRSRWRRGNVVGFELCLWECFLKGRGSILPNDLNFFQKARGKNANFKTRLKISILALSRNAPILGIHNCDCFLLLDLDLEKFSLRNP